MAVDTAAILALFAGAALLVLAVTFILRVIVILLVVNILGGETTFKKTLIVELLLSVGSSIAIGLFSWLGYAVAAIATILIYVIVYKLGLFKAIMALILIFVITAIVPLLVAYLGVKALAG